MKRVFLGGSRSISRLNDSIRRRLDELVKRKMYILIGDANGADKAMQQYFADRGYTYITVYYVGVRPRNNVGSWSTEQISTPSSARGFDFYAAKDRKMARDAECGLMLWDSKSRGTLANVEALLGEQKPVAVYISSVSGFVNLISPGDIGKLLHADLLPDGTTRAKKSSTSFQPELPLETTTRPKRVHRRRKTA